jgi:release factor glutamine methyltransferase
MDNFASSVTQRLYRSVDILIFNPPYVRSPSSEVQSLHDPILASCSGGDRGREVIDRLIAEDVPEKLISERGRFYLLVISYNEPDELMRIFREKWNMKSSVSFLTLFHCAHNQVCM